jgi:hypothetical protein
MRAVEGLTHTIKHKHNPIKNRRRPQHILQPKGHLQPTHPKRPQTTITKQKQQAPNPTQMPKVKEPDREQGKCVRAV